MPVLNPAPRSHLQRRAARGVALCRAGRWKEGYEQLGRVAEAVAPGVELPGLFYSFLGYCAAWRDGRWREGLQLAERGARLEPFHPDAHVNLARIHLLRRDRQRAVDCLQRALSFHPGHPEAHRLWRRIGRRRAPVLPWFHRDHPLNRVLGRIRHDFGGTAAA